MKITVRFTGKSFPEDLQGKVVTGEVTGITFMNENTKIKETWSFNIEGCPGYDATVIQEEKENEKEPDNNPDNNPVAKDEGPYTPKSDEPPDYIEYRSLPVSKNSGNFYDMIGGSPKKVSVEW